MTVSTTGSGGFLNSIVLDVLDDIDAGVGEHGDWLTEEESIQTQQVNSVSHRLSYLDFARNKAPRFHNLKSNHEIREEVQQHINTFLANGGKIQVLPPQRTDMRYWEQTLYTPKQERRASGYVNDRISKSESLGIRMNIKSIDTLSAAGTQPSKINANLITAALGMGNLSKEAQELAYYKYTGDQATLRELHKRILEQTLQRARRERWDVRKQGILDRLINLAIDNVVNPARYRDFSDRQWAKAIGLKANHDWKCRWQQRYGSLLNRLTTMSEQADAHLERQL